MESRAPLTQQATLAQQFAAACDWWREAGVDYDFQDEPEKFLKEILEAKNPAPKAKVKTEAAPEPEKPKMGGERKDWPQALDGFAAWWQSEPTLNELGSGTRIAPRGVAEAELMVLVAMPEASDSDSLLSGPQGKLITNMLRAMKIAPDKAYIASALPRHMPHADWDGLLSSGLGDVLAHHITLAAPKRILVLGRDVLPLLGQEKRQGVREVTVNDQAIQLLASYAPQNLIENARLRADLWRRWLEWTGNA